MLLFLLKLVLGIFCITLKLLQMLDNIKLVFKNKTLVEEWLNVNSCKFSAVQRKHITTNEKEFNGNKFIDRWLNSHKTNPALRALQERFIKQKNETFTTYPIITKTENLILKVTEKMAILEGSIHKYYNYLQYNDLSNRNKRNDNDYKHLLDNNYNDFYHVQNLQALEMIKEFFSGLDLNNATITELEFGFNITVEKDPDYYIDYNFLLYDYKAPIHNYHNTDTCYAKFSHSKFGFKVYSKKKQKSLRNNIMRVEIVLKSHHLKELGINQFDDLYSHGCIEKLYAFFCEKMDSFILTDNRHQRQDLEENVKHEIGNYLEPSFWRNLTGKSNLNRIKQKFQKLLADNNMLQTKAYFKNLLDRKYEQLFCGLVDDDIQDVE